MCHLAYLQRVCFVTHGPTTYPGASDPHQQNQLHHSRKSTANTLSKQIRASKNTELQQEKLEIQNIIGIDQQHINNPQTSNMV